MLDLPVCVLESPSSSIPISGNYQNARVLVHVYTKECKWEILRQGRVRDLFVTKSLDPSQSHGWIDVTETNILDSYMPVGYLKRDIAIIMRSLAHNFMEGIARATTDFKNFHTPAVPYAVYCLPQLHEKARRILDLFGCSQVTGEDPDRDHGRDAVVRHDVILKRAWKASDLGRTNAALTHRCAEMLGDPKRLINFLGYLVEAVCWLSFTDWHNNVHLISTNFLEKCVSGSENFKLSDFHIFHGLEHNSEKPYSDRGRSWIEARCDALQKILFQGSYKIGSSFNDPTILAFEHKSIIFGQKAAIREELNLDACFFNIFSGSISMDSERYGVIYETKCLGQHDMKPIVDEQVRRLKPANLFPSLRVSSTVKTPSKDLILQRRAVIDNKTCVIDGCDRASSSLLQLLVSSPCEHDYYRELESDYTRYLVDDARRELGYGLDLRERAHFSELWIQAVDQNPVGQWLAYQKENGAILQRECCMECAMRATVDSQKADINIEHPIYIIPGRLKGEVVRGSS